MLHARALSGGTAYADHIVLNDVVDHEGRDLAPHLPGRVGRRPAS